MNETSVPRARDVLGMPVPPSWATLAATRIRNLLGSTHARMTPGFGLVLERLYGLLDNKALFCVVELGVPELLAGGPLTAREIAAAAGAEPDAIERVMRYLVSRGMFSSSGGTRYANNAATEILRGDHPYSWRDWVLFFGSEWNWDIFNRMLDRVTTGASPTESAFGSPFFDYVNEVNPEAGKAFNGAMAAGSRVQSALFAEAIDFSPYRTICDVGGGTGSTLAHVLLSHAHLRGAVFDLPALETEATLVLQDPRLESSRAEFLGGDFFEAVPAGFDLYTLFAVVHDWDDDDCVRILANISDAGPSATIMVVEKPLDPGPGADFAKSSDLLMLVLGEGGRERTAEEYESIFGRAGLTVAHRATLPSLFEVFELQPLGHTTKQRSDSSPKA
ncbi:MAG: hypothetical protein JJLCMIEE_00398 [Acidimicrobiales bacterium]|nr:MAG: hypothetical protein EDR02_13880 [Actinomycetota bacterium]MBV6507354.1 hypothetical protein [Acidimicrobiales bacterium]RIK04483.1 MAG: hypothetical protein DCC48_13225 [Acidobacteriota bacterium]